ncbi:thiol-disulfide oxidoreductase DCC family protein [Geminocystis sp. NIES-3709]|uniref:thiol-disulfide oxidoreductase DCC family protein n=1 Tax=Geminocystis sp. NIES-3709 TaxID=1617448 RepID=UPI0005FC433C|nr:DCC1-like thiol-disulfide oxidoreductase family protein [Geminocystis sp. NIES-3709]BAQ66670.1 hypothetical protein GM3709_3435 [Geminocystis sp. NIES-3709]
MKYCVIYDGNCNFCVNFVQLLEKFDRGKLFNYIPMQETKVLEQLNITTEDCQLGMIVINQDNLSERWQGDKAAEKIIELLPNGQIFITAYRGIPGLGWLGENSYLQVRDNRYKWFGYRKQTYYSSYGFGCQNNSSCSTK